MISKPSWVKSPPPPAWTAGVPSPLRTASTQSGSVLYPVLEDRAPERHCRPEWCSLWKEGMECEKVGAQASG